MGESADSEGRLLQDLQGKGSEAALSDGLDDIVRRIAATGTIRHEWELLRPLIQLKLSSLQSVYSEAGVDAEGAQQDAGGKASQDSTATTETAPISTEASEVAKEEEEEATDGLGKGTSADLDPVVIATQVAARLAKKMARKAAGDKGAEASDATQESTDNGDPPARSNRRPGTSLPELSQSINDLDGIPFTLQRICEVLAEPTRYFRTLDKANNALGKLVVVTTVLQPGPPVYGLEAAESQGDTQELEGLDESLVDAPTTASHAATNRIATPFAEGKRRRIPDGEAGELAAKSPRFSDDVEGEAGTDG